MGDIIKAEKSPYWRRFFQKQGTVVQGTWVWSADAGQTDYASLTGEEAGRYSNDTGVNLDEYKWSSIYLTKGTYKITIIYKANTTYGIAEVLFGTTSLDTKDMYAAAPTYNQVWTITFTLQSDQTADMRIRVNGKTSGDYYIHFSRFQLEKVA